MRPGIHPNYQEVQVTCACGNTWTTRSTRAAIRTDLCSRCHPFFTGEQRIVDTAGQVDRFMRRFQLAQAEVRRNKKAARAAERRSRVVSDDAESAELEIDDSEIKTVQE